MNKFCTHCGKEINENADFCLNCGKSVTKNTPINKPKNGNLPSWAVVLIILVAIFSVILFISFFIIEYEETSQDIYYDESITEI